MGSENLFHKRKAKDLKALKRTQKKRSPYDKVLIVCEGSKTEPNYLQEAIDYYKLNTANVEVDNKCGSSPKSVLERARALYKASRKAGDPYDRVYCVIDKDSHSTYQSTIDSIESLKPFFAISSIPCFEYWILLHFEKTRAPFHATGSKSICESVESRLKTFKPEYEKGNSGLFLELLDSLENAIKNAEQALNEALRENEPNPSTNMHELITYLRELSAPKRG